MIVFYFSAVFFPLHFIRDIHGQAKSTCLPSIYWLHRIPLWVGNSILKIPIKNKSRRHIFCLVANSGMLAVGLFFSIIKGWTFFFFLPHHRLSIEVWAVLHGACHSEFFHPDRNRWGRPVAHCTWSRQSRTDASTLQGRHGRQTPPPPLRSSAIHTKNRDWKLRWPFVYVTGFSGFPALKKKKWQDFLFFVFLG